MISIYAFALQIDYKSGVKIGLESDKMLWIFFCQIIMGRPLNSNVPEGRSVYLKDIYFQSFVLNSLISNIWKSDWKYGEKRRW